MSFYSIMAVGMTFVIISGGIDISVGSMMGMAALGEQHGCWCRCRKNLPGPVIVLIAALAVPMGIGLICGLINGALVVGLRMHPFIATRWGTLSIFRGASYVSSTRQEIPFQSESNSHRLHRSLFAAWTIFHQRPVPMIIMILVMFIGWFYLSQNRGRARGLLAREEMKRQQGSADCGSIILNFACMPSRASRRGWRGWFRLDRMAEHQPTPDLAMN